MPPARSQAARQQQAALNIGTAASKGGGAGSAQQGQAPRKTGTSASQGGGTGSAQQHTGSPQHKAAKKKGTSASPGGGKSSPSPSKRQPPRDRQSPATSETRSQKTKKTKPDTANFASVTSIFESAAGKDESGTAGEKESAAGEDAGEKESAAGEDETDQEDAGKEMESAAGEDAGTSPVTNPRKRTNSKTNLDDTSSDDDSEIAKGKRHSATSGNSYHLFIFN